MARTLIFDSNFKAKETNKIFDFDSSQFFWTHMNINEDAEAVLAQMLKKKKEFIEDILEEQRPNIVQVDNLNIIILSFPSRRSKILQLTFILGRRKIITITNRESRTINSIMEDIKIGKTKIIGVTDLFSLITDKIIEKSFKKLEELEDDIAKMEINIVKRKENKMVLSHTNLIKEDLFIVSKLVRGDLEVMREILEGKIKALNLRYFGEHFEDRILYLHDYIEVIKESVNNVNNLYVSMLSHRLNEYMYTLTIIGALMLIPTIISGFFGMNVALPQIEFWEIFFLTILLCGLGAVILRLFFSRKA